MRRLIVTDILVCNRHTINGILHQCDETMRYSVGGDEQQQAFPISRRPEYFLSPVSQDVCNQAGVPLGSVDGNTAEIGRIEQQVATLALRYPFFDLGVVQQFT